MTDASIDPVRRVSGPGIPVRGSDIDTDQIIPARFLKAITFDGLGEFAFFDQRFDEHDNPKDHPFNDDRFQDARILVVNSNFGCGSSREHAPQALLRWGIDGIIGESFAEIFEGNCLALGIPTVTADHKTVVTLQDWIEEHPSQDIAIDVESTTITYNDDTIDVTMDDTQRTALLEGIWDTTTLLRSNADDVRETAESLPYVDV